MDRWVYDLERTLRSRLDTLADRLDCEDAQVEQQAEKEADDILSLLYGPVKSESREERQRSIEQELVKSGLPPARIKALAKRESRFTGRAAGRPRELGPNAIRALTLHLTTAKSWREIALEVKGCNHICSACGRVKTKPFVAGKQVRRSQPKCPKCGLAIRPRSQMKQSCSACGDAVRHLAEDCKAIVKRLGLFPKVPGRKKLSGFSPAELERIWPSLD